MEPNKPAGPQWLRIIATSLGIVIVLIAVGTLMWERSIYVVFGQALGTEVERLVIKAGLGLSLPLGVLQLLIGGYGLARRGLSRGVALACLATGIVGVLTGAFWRVIIAIS